MYNEYIKKGDFDFNYIDLSDYKLERLSAKAMSASNGSMTLVQYVNTVVVEQDTEKNTIKLNTDGWQTVTSKRWINEYLPRGYFISQFQYDWYVITDGTPIQGKKDLKARLESGSIIEYKDNLIINY